MGNFEIFNVYVFAWSSLMLSPEIFYLIPIISAAPLEWPELRGSLQWLSHVLCVN